MRSTENPNDRNDPEFMDRARKVYRAMESVDTTQTPPRIRETASEVRNVNVPIYPRPITSQEEFETQLRKASEAVSFLLIGTERLYKEAKLLKVKLDNIHKYVTKEK